MASNKSDDIDDAAELMSEAMKQSDSSLLKKRSYQQITGNMSGLAALERLEGLAQLEELDKAANENQSS